MTKINTHHEVLCPAEDDLTREQVLEDVRMGETPLVTTAHGAQSIEDKWCAVHLCQEVMRLGFPNAWRARIPIYSRWNLQLLSALLTNYEDREIVMYMKYGWPISRPPTGQTPPPCLKTT